MILLSFDTEEFDVPREHGVDFTLEQGMAVSKVGTNRILDVLKQNGVKATFFCTGNFAEQAPEVMQRIMDEGHEVACHGVDHWQPKDTDFPYVPCGGIRDQESGLPLQLVTEPCLHSWTLYAPHRTAYLVYERRGNADSRLCHATHPFPAVLACPPQPARRTLSLDDAPRAQEGWLLRHLLPSLGVLRAEGAPRVQDAVYHQEPQWPADVRPPRSSRQNAPGRRP